MLILKYPAKTLQTNELEERLRELSLAHRVEIDLELKELALIEGKITFTGAEKISEHLDELARELFLWQFCTCTPEPTVF